MAYSASESVGRMAYETGSRMGSTAAMPLPVAQRTQEATVYREDPFAATASQVTVVAPSGPQSRTEELDFNGARVTHTETREALQPLISQPQFGSAPAVVREEKLPAIVSTRAFEVFRRDPATLFPGAKVINNPGPVTTPSGSIYDPVTNTITSAFNGQTTQVQIAHHIGATPGLNVGGNYAASAYAAPPAYGAAYSNPAANATTYTSAYSTGYVTYPQEQFTQQTTWGTHNAAPTYSTYFKNPDEGEASYYEPTTPGAKVSFQTTPQTRYIATPGTSYIRQPSWTSQPHD